MKLPDYIVRQLAKPTGLLGRFILWELNRVNSPMNVRALNALGIEATDRVLEIGFGGGDLLDEIISRKPQSVTGVEVSKLALGKAHSRFSQALTEGMLNLVQIGSGTLPFENGSFSKVCCVNVIYFWDDPIATMTEVNRVIRPEGKFVVCYEPLGPNARETPPERVEGYLRSAGFPSVMTVHDRDRSSGEFYCSTATKH